MVDEKLCMNNLHSLEEFQENIRHKTSDVLIENFLFLEDRVDIE
jgi:hypothetical protein